MLGSWRELLPARAQQEPEQEEVRGVSVLLPPGVHPPVWVSRKLLGLQRLVLLGPPLLPVSALSSSSSSLLASSSSALFSSCAANLAVASCAASLSNPRVPELNNFAYNCLTVVSSKSWSSLDENQKRDAPWSKSKRVSFLYKKTFILRKFRTTS